MIRINLLGVERRPARKKIAFDAGHKLTVGCGIILIAATSFIGWRYRALSKASASLDAEIATAQRERGALQSIIGQVQQFEQRRAQLQQRVVLIEQLRKDQMGPVHILDQISRALPPMLWLTQLKQGENPNEVVIEGRCLSQTAVSDFAHNLEASGYFRRSVDIMGSQTETLQAPPGTLVKFTLKALFQTPGESPRTEVAAAGKQAR